jgi:PKD repeat protein
MAKRVRSHSTVPSSYLTSETKRRTTVDGLVADPRSASPRALAPRRSRWSGQSVVEFAIVLPLFMLILLITIDFGRMFFSYVQLNNAAREGAAYAATNPTDSTGITAHAAAETNSQAQRGENPISVSTACVDTSAATIPCSTAAGGGGPGFTVSVTATETFSFITPWIDGFFGNNFKMASSASTVALGLAPNVTATQPPGCAAPSFAEISVAGSGLTIDVDGSSSQPSSGLCHISGYNWAFGDGVTDVSYATGTVHTYAAAGTYTVTLTVTNQGGTATTTTTVVVPLSTTCLAPTAAFSIAPPTGVGGGAGTTFGYDASSSTNMGVAACNPHFIWDFGDGTIGPDASSATHKYSGVSGGRVMTVRLTTTNDAGSDQSTQTLVLH